MVMFCLGTMPALPAWGTPVIQVSQDGRRYRQISAINGSETVGQFLNDINGSVNPPFTLHYGEITSGFYVDQTHNLMSFYAIAGGQAGPGHAIAQFNVDLQNLTTHDFLGFRNDWHQIHYRPGSISLTSTLDADGHNKAFAVTGLRQGRSFNFTMTGSKLSGINSWRVVDGNPNGSGRFDSILLFKKLYLREVPGRLRAALPPGGVTGGDGGSGSGGNGGGGSGGIGVGAVPEPSTGLLLLIIPVLLRRQRSRV